MYVSPRLVWGLLLSVFIDNQISGRGLMCLYLGNTFTLLTYHISSKNLANKIFIEEFLVQIFGGKFCYELKINYFMPKLEGCTAYYLYCMYSCIDLLPDRLDSRSYVEP